MTFSDPADDMSAVPGHLWHVSPNHKVITLYLDDGPEAAYASQSSSGTWVAMAGRSTRMLGSGLTRADALKRVADYAMVAAEFDAHRLPSGEQAL